MTRYGIFVHDPDGDSGYGVVVGAMSEERAMDKASSIRRRGELQGRDVEAIVLPLVSGGVSARDIARRVVDPAELEEQPWRSCDSGEEVA